MTKTDSTTDEELAEPAFRSTETAAKRRSTDSLSRRLVNKGKRLRLPKLTRKQWLFTGIATVMLGAAGSTAWALNGRVPPPDNSPSQKTVYNPPEPPKPTTVASRLTGVQVTPELNNLPTTAVMIENSPDARPQAGLFEAGIVYEMQVEGGITRFMAVYQESQPARIGPVRSSRPPYLDFLLQYDAGYAHAGGSGQALAEIRAFGVKDIDHGANGGAFQRDAKRFAPHNLYTSRSQLLAVQRARGWNTSTYTGFMRKAEEPAPAPSARAIDLSVSSFLYNPHFDYDAASNSYVRSMAGKPHVDETTGKALNPKVVVALVMSHSHAGIYSVYGTSGSGKAYIFQDGIFIDGTWSKDGRSGRLLLGDINGSPIGLNPGQTWISLVGGTDRVKITP